MPSIWSALSSSSSSPASYSGGGRQLKGKSKSSNDIWKNSASNEPGRRLTRQRKLRHATDDELGLDSRIIHEGPQSLPVSTDCGRTPIHARRRCHWSKLAEPKPLPLPEVSCQPKQNDGSHGPRLGNRGASPCSGETRCLSRLNFGKITDDMVTKTKGCSAYHRRGFQEDLNADTSENDFCLHFPAGSAPSSGCSSPVPSSQRYRTLDLFHPLFQVSSASETVKSVTIHRKSKSHQVSPLLSPEHSPLQSPTRQGNSKNCVALVLHSHNKSLPESSVVKTDTNNSSVHPLPRPPTVSRLSPTWNSFDKYNISSLKGQWQKGKLIGCGTYGNVYIATHRETGATCALKEVEMILDDPKCLECVKQLEQEIKFLRELKHPNIVEYYGCEIIEDRFCIYLEYVHPGSISKYIKEHNDAMTESIVRNFTRHILSGLAYLHSKMTIHRDIKGANLLVDASGVVKLADFGLAKHFAGHHIDLSLKGTPHWMAPEVLQAAMRKDTNPDLACGVDIWGLGCTVLEMLTGKPPWSEYNPVQAMFNVLNKSPGIPETLSAEGRDFLNRCFQRRPADRPTALELLDHPFLRCSQDQNTTGFVHESSGIKLHDLESSSKWARATRHNKDVMANSSAMRIQQGKLPLLPNSSSETSQHPGAEASESGSSSRQSPYCILEILPRVSSPDGNWRRHPGSESSESRTPSSHQSPHSILQSLPRVYSPPEVRCSSNSSSPSNVQNNLLVRAVGNNIYSFSCKGNLDLMMPKMVERKKEHCNVQQEIN